MKILKKKTLKSTNGITLIALVITIIVLLILAGISISMLSGDNSILQKATDAKQTSEREEAKEQAKIDIMAWITDKTANHQDASLDDAKVKEILTGKSYVKEAKDSSFITAKGEYEIPYSELYTASDSNVDTVGTEKVAEINSKIGIVVDGYSAKNLDWQVFYADSSETFLISKTLAKTNYTIPVKGEGKSSDYSGSVNVRSSAYGAKWNEKWLAKCTADTENGGESARANAKLTAYLCDPDNWNEYKTGSASYAVGGPTIELLIASWNKSQGASIDLIDSDVIPVGYFYDKPVEFAYSCIVTSDVKNGVYNPSEDYWLASPCILDRHDNYVNYTGDGDDMRCVYSNGSVSGMPYYYRGQFWSEPQNGVRPIVSIPTSKINIEGDTVTVLP